MKIADSNFYGCKWSLRIAQPVVHFLAKNYGNPDTGLYGEVLKYKRSTDQSWRRERLHRYDFCPHTRSLVYTRRAKPSQCQQILMKCSCYYENGHKQEHEKLAFGGTSHDNDKMSVAEEGWISSFLALLVSGWASCCRHCSSQWAVPTKTSSKN